MSWASIIGSGYVNDPTFWEKSLKLTMKILDFWENYHLSKSWRRPCRCRIACICVMWHHTCVMWHHTCVTWHHTCVMWHHTCAMWHHTCVMWHHACVMWHHTCVTWHHTCVMWHHACVMWHHTCVTWHHTCSGIDNNSLAFSPLSTPHCNSHLRCCWQTNSDTCSLIKGLYMAYIAYQVEHVRWDFGITRSPLLLHRFVRLFAVLRRKQSLDSLLLIESVTVC
jgi:hypothetical protein